MKFFEKKKKKTNYFAIFLLIIMLENYPALLLAFFLQLARIYKNFKEPIMWRDFTCESSENFKSFWPFFRNGFFG